MTYVDATNDFCFGSNKDENPIAIVVVKRVL